MNRRAFGTGLGAVLAAPLGAGAQQPGRVPRVGEPVSDPQLRKTFRQDMREFGYVDGRTITFESRDVDGPEDRLE